MMKYKIISYIYKRLRYLKIRSLNKKRKIIPRNITSVPFHGEEFSQSLKDEILWEQNKEQM